MPIEAFRRIRELEAQVADLQAELTNMTTKYGKEVEHNQRLHAENRQLKEESRWIPVSERLPKNIATVFVLTGEGAGGIGFYGKDEKGFRWERLDHAINLNITHWKPIVLPDQAVKETQ